MVTYVITTNSRNTEIIILHFFKRIVSHNKSTHFGSIILASDCIRAWVWNLSNAKSGNLWFRGQFLVINEETHMNGLD